MGKIDKEYEQLRDIKLQDILGLPDGPFKIEALNRLAECGFIREKKLEWQEITIRDLHKIRPGVTLKRVVRSSKYESIIHVTSDPYWTSWEPSNAHILVCTIEPGSGHGTYNGHNEYSINDLFNGCVYINR